MGAFIEQSSSQAKINELHLDNDGIVVLEINS